MPYATAPDTLAIGNQIVSFLSTLTHPGASTLVYNYCQLEAIKDVTDRVANGGICVEVYGNEDNSERRGYGGRIWETQTWFILSLCSLDTPDLAAQIYGVRDALSYTFNQHATLGAAVSNLFHSQLNPNMHFGRDFRSSQWLRTHLATLTTKAEYAIEGGIIS